MPVLSRPEIDHRDPLAGEPRAGGDADQYPPTTRPVVWFSLGNAFRPRPKSLVFDGRGSLTLRFSGGPRSAVLFSLPGCTKPRSRFSPVVVTPSLATSPRLSRLALR
jgi:hypothetical protein